VTRDSLVKRTAAAMSTAVDDELVIIHFDSNAYYGFDVIGRRIWELIEEPLAVTDLCRVLCEEYDVAPERCESDVLSFLGELAQSQVVESVDVIRA
jgi:hypothetical protein